MKTNTGNICNGVLVLCAVLLAFNVYLLIDHKQAAWGAIAKLSEMNDANLEAHSDMMAGCSVKTHVNR